MSKSTTKSAMHTSEAFYQTLVESLPVGVLFTDSNGVHLYVNKQASQMTGYSIEELITGVWLVHPDDTKAAVLCEQAVREGISGSDYETRFVRKDGSVFWASVSWKPVRDEHGGIAGLCTVFVDISDRKNAEDQLRIVDERYRVLSENASDMIWEMAADGTFTYVSQAVRKLGYEPEEWIGHRLVEFLAPDEVPVFLERLQRDLQDPHPVPYEVRALCKDGSDIYMEVMVDFVVADVSPMKVHGVARDITRRKAAEEELQQVNEHYRLLAENASDLLWALDLDGTITYVSQAVRQLGYEPEDWIGHQGLEFMLPEEHAPFIQRMSVESIRNYRPATHQLHLRRKDGSAVWLEVMRNIIRLNGVPVGVQGVARDITLRKQAEEALRESEQKYRSIVEKSSDLIMLCRPDGVWTYASPACRDITGYEPEEVVGTVHRLSLPEDAEWLVPMYLRALNGESRSRLEYRIVTKNGEFRWVSHSWSPIFVGERLQAVLSVIRDVTEAKKSEEVRLAAHAELEQAYKLQREFLNNVTHEVRTPLTAVKGYAEMLMEGMAGPVSQEQTALLGKVLTSSQHLLDVVNGVLEIARLKSGKIALNPRVCNPRLIVDKSASTIVPQAEQKGLAINIQSDPTPCPGMYDEDKLVIILTNLLTNAVKFTKTGSIDVLIGCGTSGAEIVVADTGMGISSSDLPTIFDEFSQLEYPHKHKPSGFGIGLAIVATMVETIGASLTVSSRKGVGTAFTLRVPVLEEQPLGGS